MNAQYREHCPNISHFEKNYRLYAKSALQNTLTIEHPHSHKTNIVCVGGRHLLVNRTDRLTNRQTDRQAKISQLFNNIKTAIKFL